MCFGYVAANFLLLLTHSRWFVMLLAGAVCLTCCPDIYSFHFVVVVVVIFVVSNIRNQLNSLRLRHIRT